MDNEASNTDSLSKLKKLLDQGINVNAKDAKGRTLFHHAVSNNEPEVVKCLLANGVDVLVTDNIGYTALHITVTKDDEAMVKVILENVARDKLRKLIDMQIKSSKSAALHIAAKSESYGIVVTLLKYGANYEIVNSDGKKPIDVGGESLRLLFQVIRANFVRAKRGDEKLHLDLQQCNMRTDFVSLFNCRNKDGRTFVQELISNEHYRAANHVLAVRISQAVEGFDLFDDPNRKEEAEELAQIARDSVKFWNINRITICAMVDSLEKCGSRQAKLTIIEAGKLSCEALEKAHQVFLAYRKFEGKQKTLTSYSSMKNLEEILEELGFDPEQHFVIAGENACYYKKIPLKLKQNIYGLMHLINDVVDSSVFALLNRISTYQIFDAVKVNDVDRVRNLLKSGGIVNAIDHRSRTALAYAVENGNRKMIRLLLKSGAQVAFNGAISPMFLAIDRVNTKYIKSLLENVDPEEMKDFIDMQHISGATYLHNAAEKGRLDFVKLLLRHGATYCIVDKKKRTPLNVSTNEEVSTFLKIVDECFHDAKEGNIDLIHKLKVMEYDELMAVANAKNLEGLTLVTAAAKANAKNIAVIILRMLKEAKQEEK